MHFDSIVWELLWFLKGATNINDGLSPHTKIWDAWADHQGELGPIYGHQWRRWTAYDPTTNRPLSIDQLTNVINNIQTDPTSRRLMVSAWNVGDLDGMALPPCHVLFQFYVDHPMLDCQLYQRSADIALGLPFNIASYALLLSMIAQACRLTPRYLIHTLGDAHIYENHIKGLRTQLERTPGPRPKITLADKTVLDMRFEDITLHHYHHAPPIHFDIAK